MEKIDLTPLISLFNDFFTTIYKQKINELLLVYPTKKSLIIDYRELEKFDPDLADKLVHEPDITIEAAETAIAEMKLTLPISAGEFTPHVRFSDLPSSDLLIEQLSSKNLSEIVAFKGVITRRAELMNRVKIAVYLCQVCDSEMRALVTKNFTPPKKCESCKKFALRQVDEMSKFVDIQRAEIQELLERVRGGAPAAHIELWLEDDLVNIVSPGDNIEVVGILRLRPPLKMRQKQELVYTRYIEVISAKSLRRDFEEIEITKEDERRILELSKNPNIEDLIVKSIAPAIYGHEEVKRALALQLFGGTRGKTIPGGLPIRDDIHVLLIGDPGLAKCVSGESDIILSDGSIVSIKNVVECVLENNKKEDPEGYYGFSNHDLLSMDVDGRTSEKKATVFWKLKSPAQMYEFETASGKKLIVTPTHPFFITDNARVLSRKAEELNIGDFISTPHRLFINGALQYMPTFKHGKTNANSLTLPSHVDERFARFLGYLIGDGYVRKTSSYEISLTNSDSVLIDDFTNIVHLFNLKEYIEKSKENSNTFHITVFSVDLGQILEKMGLVKNSFEKAVPIEVMKSPNSILKEFIKAYFDCEAHVSKDGIAVVSASEKLLKQVQLLLLRFGILSQLHPTYSRATNAKNHKKTKYWCLYLCGENAKLYFSAIGFASPAKMKKRSKLPKHSNTNIDVIPGLSKILKETRIALDLSQFQCGIPRTTYQHFERGDRNPSYNSLRKIITAFRQINSNNEAAAISLKLLEELSNSDIFWDRVVKKQKINASEEWVYDLQVDGVHNFIANGVFVHNSRFLHQVSELAPKSIYVSGKSVSSAGLTVSAEKDELGDGGWTLKAGALVLASGGNIAIDEFDKISEEDRSAMHEAMESQQISVAKAGIVAQFKSKTAILAAANPKYGRFDQTRNLAEQFEVAPTLLSRFDLIFPIVDILDEEKDLRLAQHILSAHTGRATKEEERLIDKELLRKYVAYARRGISPQLANAAVEKIRDFYVELRKMSKDVGAVAITPRYLEGLVRLCEADAKMRLSPLAEERDADVAISLMRYVMKQVMTDKVTGLFDVDTVTTGKPKSEREKLQKIDVILEIIRTHLKKEDSVDVEIVIGDAASYGIDEQTARRIISDLLRRGEIYEREHGHIRLVGDRS